MKVHLLFQKLFSLAILLSASVLINAQTTADFESFDLEAGEYLDSSTTGGFDNGNIFLPNSNTGFWNGWSVSAATDVETRGFMNQFSSITGGGANGSIGYAVYYQFGTTNYILPTGMASGGYIQGMDICNGTYGYYSMLEGDGFAKRFGGETGDDPDYLLLTFTAFLDGVEKETQVEFYLADYRFNDNSMDYIIADWTYVDLQPLGNLDSLSVMLSSTDNSEFGMNTPGYFFVDNIVTADETIVNSANIAAEVEQLSVSPNPATDRVQINWPYQATTVGRLFNLQGQVVTTIEMQKGMNELNVSELPAGIYTLVCEGEKVSTVNRLVKK